MSRYLPFEVQKAVQTAAVILRSESGWSMSRLRLSKLLYIANRKMIRKHGRPIFEARTVAMKHGPLHSEVYDLIRGGGVGETEWSRFVRIHGPREVRLVEDPGAAELSSAEIDAIDETIEETARYDDWEIVELTHEFPEWKRNYPRPEESTSRTISFEDILEAVGMQDYAEQILSEREAEAEFDRLFAS